MSLLSHCSDALQTCNLQLVGGDVELEGLELSTYR